MLRRFFSFVTQTINIVTDIRTASRVFCVSLNKSNNLISAELCGKFLFL